MPLPSIGQLTNRIAHRQANRFMHAVAALGYRLPRGNPDRYGVLRIADVPYRDTGKFAHLLDVYRPKAPAPPEGYPVVFYVHGGGFAMLSKETHRIMALAFASRGYLVVNVNYRLGRSYPHPIPLEDVTEALLWTAANVTQHGGDLDRLVLAGESAGANLVAALAVALSVPRPEAVAKKLFASGLRPRAVLPIYGLLDVTDMARFERRKKIPRYILGQVLHAAEAYVGTPEHGGAYRHPLASPLRIIEEMDTATAARLPPFFVACGTKDPLLDDSRRLARALDRLGVHHETVIHPGEIHGYNVMLWRPAAREMWSRAFSFLRRAVPSATSPARVARDGLEAGASSG
jgi:acetyl esterase